ncbi:MAG: SurA N-terminal domain-containing protein [Anaerolineae bacterium]|nr:SurA N-terminal domain-containing protein [Anaerolineae bacterium]
MTFRLIRFSVPLLLLLFVVACSDAPDPPTVPQETGPGSTADDTQTATAQPQPPPTDTPIPPTPTPEEPLAATVNGQPIYLSAFEEELVREERGLSLVPAAAAATAGDTSTRMRVLDMLIERALIEQAAQESGIEITPEMVSAQMEELRRVAEEAGGPGSFEAWLQANQWTAETFQEALAFEMLTEQLSAVLTASVPYTVEQVHARYIQVDDAALAQTIIDELANGASFAELAREHSLDRTTGNEGGDLGYFPRGSLLVPEIETAAFALAPGETSDVITATTPDGTQTTYYIVHVVDVDPARPLSPDLRAILLQERFESWLQERWDQAEIIRIIDTGAS